MSSARSTTSLRWAFHWLSAAAVALATAGLMFGATAPAGAPSSWIEEVQRNLARQEYELTWQNQPVVEHLAAAWQAPNRAQGMRSYFVQDGIRVVPREEEKPSWVWGLSLAGYGRGTKLWPVEKARLSAGQNRIDYSRGMVEEWYVNDPRGLKQGFVLKAPPEEAAESIAAAPFVGRVAPPRRAQGEKGASLIHLDLELRGTLMPVVVADGQAIDFVAAGGARAVRYTELVVTDARGRRLSSWMEGVADEVVRGIRLILDDTEAIYPIIIDPLANSPTWTAEGDQMNASLGWSAGSAGDVNGDGYADVIVGAPGYDNGQAAEGRALVYVWTIFGMSDTPVWTAECDQANANFGLSVGTAGDVNGDGYSDVIVGASFFDNGETNEGRAFVYMGSATGLAASAAWTAERNQTEARFGVPAGTAGDVNGDGYSDVIVGAYFRGNGEAFVYMGSATGLSPVASWTAEGSHAASWFGQAVGTAGDVNGDGYSDVVVGAPLFSNGEANEGRAYVYLGSAAGLSPVASWTAESNQNNGNLGKSVGTAGDVNGNGYADLIVGVPGFWDGLNGYGRALVYPGSPVGLSSAASWTATGNTTGALGLSVGTAGDVNGDGYADVILGIPYADHGQTDEGQAFLYLGSASGLSASPDWTAESDQAEAHLGWAAAAAGDVNGDGYADVIVGAERYDNGQDNEGRAFVYLGSAAGLAASAGWTVESNQSSAQLGVSVGTAGDVNGDGYADVIVGAPYYDNGQVDEGRAVLYLGSVPGLSALPAWFADGNQTNAFFGFSVGTAGDVNGDGYADVIVGAFGFDNGQVDEGRAYVFPGSASGLSTSPSWTAESNQTGARFGYAAATAGDVNGDGYSDVIVGAFLYGNDEPYEGRAFAYLGSASGLSPTPGWTAESNQTSSFFGLSVGTAGDVNGDGYSDVLVGAYLFDNGESDEGGAFAYLGSPLGLSSSPSWTAEGDQVEGSFGISLGTAGDVNGDGYADVIVGAHFFDNGEIDEGRAFVYMGSASGLSPGASWTAESDQQGDTRFGASVGTAGDVNGDGYADVIVGAYGFDNGESNEGRAFVYHGSAAGLTLSPAWSAESNQANAQFSYVAATAGDVNGDGYSDVVVGAYLHDNVEADEGKAFVYYGNHGPGLSVRPQQRRADDLAPIAQGGRSRVAGSFRLAALGRSPFGRSDVRLEWEVKRRGELFDGAGTQRSTAWQDAGTAGAAINELISGLEPGGHHWRVRLHFDPVSSPFLHVSRWFSMPWNGWQETDLSISSFIGGAVWNDLDEDGIRDATEPPLDAVIVDLTDDNLTLLDQRFTNGQGEYRFEISDNGAYRVRFTALDGYRFTLPDQGTDDELDSDADTVTGATEHIPFPHRALDATSWSAGLVSLCDPPDQPIFISGVRLGGLNFPILDLQDGNQPSQATGYHVYRSSNAAVPPGFWPRVAFNVADFDSTTPEIQWVDQSGNVSPTGIWYYEVTAYNSYCDVEGPF